MRKTNLMLVAGLFAFSGMALGAASDQGCESSGNTAAGCSNEVIVGERGPQGPKGDTGEQGPAGQDGVDGRSFDPEFINEMRALVSSNEEKINASAAGAYAAASHQFDVYGDAQLSVAGGFYEGENAVSVAYGRAINEDVFVHGNVTQDSQGNTGGALGVTFQLN